MALSPLSDKPQRDNGTPLDGGISVRGAQDYIANLLDDDGRTPGHVDHTKGEEPSRGGTHTQQDEQQFEQEEGLKDDGQKDEDAVGTDETDNTSDEEGELDSDTNSDGDISEKKADSDEQEAESSISSLSDLAEALEMSTDDLKGTLTHTFKAAGEEHTVTLADLEKGYQLQADYDRGKGKLSEDRKAFEKAHREREQEFDARNVELANGLQMAEQMVMQEYSPEAMENLKQVDPTQWLIKQHEAQNRLNTIREARNKAAQEYEQGKANQRNEYLAAEGRILAETVPGWNDDMLSTAVDTFKTLGFDDGEIPQIANSKTVKAVLELKELREKVADYEAKLAKANDTVNKVKKTVPKAITAGKTILGDKTRSGLNGASINKMRGRLKASGSVKDAASIIEQLL